MSKFEMHAYSEMLPKMEGWEDGGPKYLLYLDDRQPGEGSIVNATRQARIHARATHREFASWHEAAAVIREEFEEFWDSVKLNHPDMDELLQIAACCQLAIKELGNSTGERGIADSQVTDLLEELSECSNCGEVSL